MRGMGKNRIEREGAVFPLADQNYRKEKEMQKNYRKIARFGFALAAMAALLLQSCATMGPETVLTEPEFDLRALQRASMAEVAEQLGFDIDGEQSSVKKDAKKTVWKYKEVDTESGSGFTTETSDMDNEFFFNNDDELYLIKITTQYINSTYSASKNSARSMRKMYSKLHRSFTEQLGVEPELSKPLDTVVRRTWKTDENIKIVSEIDDEFTEKYASFYAVTKIQFLKE
jgi:hypothetical protein